MNAYIARFAPGCPALPVTPHAAQALTAIEWLTWILLITPYVCPCRFVVDSGGVHRTFCKIPYMIWYTNNSIQVVHNMLKYVTSTLCTAGAYDVHRARQRIGNHTCQGGYATAGSYQPRYCALTAHNVRVLDPQCDKNPRRNWSS